MPQSSVAPKPRSSVGFALSVGAAYLPIATGGDGGTTAGFIEAAAVLRAENNDFRLGGLVAYESTNFQSSDHGLLTLRSDHAFGSGVYALGYGLGLGYGSFSPKGDFNADNGGSFELALYAVPMLLSLGPKKAVEVSVELGAIRLFAFDELDPFYNLSIGFATW